MMSKTLASLKGKTVSNHMKTDTAPTAKKSRERTLTGTLTMPPTIILENIIEGYTYDNNVFILKIHLAIGFARMITNGDNSQYRHGPSPIRWAGSKRYVVGGLSDFVSKSGRHYVEPFAGSAAIFFGAKPKTATLGDLNGHLINFYRQLRKSPIKLHASMCRIPRSSEAYYSIREKFNNTKLSPFEKAIYFAYLNRNCFNGIWRTNKSGNFNVPYSKNSRSTYPSEQHYSRSAKTLKRAELKSTDFRVLLKDTDMGNAIVFADPPYFSGKDRVFIEYGAECFQKSDLDDLIEVLHQSADRGAHVILSYNTSENLQHYFPKWDTFRLTVTRNVGGFSGSRKRTQELFISSVPIRPRN